MSDYFVIDGRDGDATVQRMGKRDLLTMIASEEYAGVDFVELAEGVSPFPATLQICEFGDNSILVIKGKQVVPAPQKHVVTWGVD